MNSITIRIAHLLLRLAIKLAPADKGTWAKAMQAEMLNIPKSDAPAFALGCLWAMAKARAAISSTILSTARWTLVLGAVAWSALHIRLAGLLAAVGANQPSTLAYIAAAAIAVGGCLTAARGLRVAVMLGVPVTAMAVIVAIGIDQLVPQTSLAHFYRAIAIEYVVILVVAMMIAIGLPRLVEHRERLVQ